MTLAFDVKCSISNLSSERNRLNYSTFNTCSRSLVQSQFLIFFFSNSILLFDRMFDIKIQLNWYNFKFSIKNDVAQTTSHCLFWYRMRTNLFLNVVFSRKFRILTSCHWIERFLNLSFCHTVLHTSSAIKSKKIEFKFKISYFRSVKMILHWLSNAFEVSILCVRFGNQVL